MPGIRAVRNDSGGRSASWALQSWPRLFYRGLMTFYRDEPGARLPVKIDATSNGELAPQPLTAPHFSYKLADHWHGQAAVVSIT